MDSEIPVEEGDIIERSDEKGIRYRVTEVKGPCREDYRNADEKGNPKTTDPYFLIKCKRIGHEEGDATYMFDGYVKTPDGTIRNIFTTDTLAVVEQEEGQQLLFL